MAIDLWWEHSDDLSYMELRVGKLSKTPLAILRRSNKGRQYFLTIELPNYDLEQIELGDHTSKPFDVQMRRAEDWVRRWFDLAMRNREE